MACARGHRPAAAAHTLHRRFRSHVSLWLPCAAGKTTAVVEAVLQEVKRGNRVLACAASNIAVLVYIPPCFSSLPVLPRSTAHGSRALPPLVTLMHELLACAASNIAVLPT